MRRPSCSTSPLMNRFLRGLLAGTLATVPMTLVMQSLHRWPYPERDALPPDQITQSIAGEVRARTGVGESLDEAQTQALTLVNHFGFGAALGGVYALISPHIRAHPAFKGAAWGLIVWGFSYGGWLPAAHILPPATRQSRRRNLLLIAAHLVWGVSNALVTERLTPKDTL